MSWRREDAGRRERLRAAVDKRDVTRSQPHIHDSLRNDRLDPQFPKWRCNALQSHAGHEHHGYSAADGRNKGIDQPDSACAPIVEAAEAVCARDGCLVDAQEDVRRDGFRIALLLGSSR
jgi:hypothetical protein